MKYKPFRACLKIKGLQTINLIISILSTSSLFALTYFLSLFINGLESEETNISLFYWMLPLLLFIYILFTSLICFTSRYLYIKASKDEDFFCTNMILKKNSDFFQKYGGGEILNYVKNMGASISFFEAKYPWTIIGDLFTLSSFAFLLFYYSWKIAILVIVIVIILMFLTSAVSKKLGIEDVKMNEQFGKTYSAFNELIEKSSLIHFLNQRTYFFEKYKTEYEKGQFRQELISKALTATYMVIYAIFVLILPLATLLIGLFFKNFFLVNIGSLVSIYSILGNIQEPLRSVSSFIAEYKKNQESKKKLSFILNNENEDEKVKLISITSFDYNCKGIDFMGKKVLSNVSFHLDTGDFCLLKGESGIGKSTLLKTILGEVNCPEVTNIFFNGILSSQLKIFPAVLIVTQDPQLFHSTIRENILCGMELDQKKMKEICDVCVLNDFINHYGFEKIIDNSTSNISGGEKERLCLARILYREPKMLLLDEITSALDETTSSLIASNVYEFVKVRRIVVICISHKNEFDKYANKVIELKKIK